MRKPVVGVIPLYDDEKESLWMLPGYFDGIRDAGGLPIMLPLEVSSEDALQAYTLCDGLLFTGGHDVDPALYHEEIRPTCGGLNPARDALEETLFRRAFLDDLPVLGICRGIQLINALMGGSLYQDLPTEFHSEHPVEHVMQLPYDRACHTVELVKGSPLAKRVGQDVLGVNSYHHQAIRRLAGGLTPMAYAPDGLMEAVCCEEKRFLWAVQWHPEFSYRVDSSSALIFHSFVEACGDSRN